MRPPHHNHLITITTVIITTIITIIIIVIVIIIGTILSSSPSSSSVAPLYSSLFDWTSFGFAPLFVHVAMPTHDLYGVCPQCGRVFSQLCIMISFTDLGLTIVWYYAHASDRVPSVQAISCTGRLAIDVATCIGIVRSYGNNSRRKRYDLWENGVCMGARARCLHGSVV